MHTKKETELMSGYALESLALKDLACAMGYAMSGLTSHHKEGTEGYCSPVVLRTLYKAAKTEMPKELQRALRAKQPAFAITQNDLLALMQLAAHHAGEEYEHMVDGVIAELADMPVRKLTTVFPKRSSVEIHVNELAATQIEQARKNIENLKDAGATHIEENIPTTREVANNFVLHEIFRFASYTKLTREVDYQRSRVTKGNVIYLCCSDKFAQALSDARIPGLVGFKQDKPSSAAAWPYTQKPA